MKTTVFALLLATLLLLGCAGFSGDLPSSGSEEYGGDYGDSAPSATRNLAVPGEETYAQGAPSAMMDSDYAYAKEAAVAPSPAPTADVQYVTKQGTLTVEVKQGELEGKLAQAKSLLSSQGATITNVAFREYYSTRSYSVTFKIAPEKFDQTVESLKALGEIKAASVGIEDVTRQYTDLDMRIANKEVELYRLQQLYNKSGTVEELLAVEKSVSRVEVELESLKAQKKDLQGRIDLSTVTLQLSEPVAPKEAKEGEIQIEVQQGGLEAGLAKLKALSSSATVVSMNYAETSQYMRYFVVIKAEPSSLDSLMEGVKGIGEVTGIEKSIDEENRPKKSLLYVRLQENKPAVETDFMGNLKDVGGIFFGALSLGLFALAGLAGVAIPVIIVLAILYFIYRKWRGRGKKKK